MGEEPICQSNCQRMNVVEQGGLYYNGSSMYQMQYTSSYPLSNKPFTRSRFQKKAQSDYDTAHLIPNCIQLNGTMQLNQNLTMQFTDQCFMHDPVSL